MIELLDKILLSDNVKDEFYKNYENKEFKTWLLSILPEIEDCAKQQQDNPWHIYNCLDHILHSVETINKLDKDYDKEVRRELAYTMFLHDIGKPKCYIRRYSKLYGREVDSFFNHNLESEKIAKRVLPQFNFNEKQQQVINLLVENHDIFMFIKQTDDGNKFHKVLTMKLFESYVNEFNKVDDGTKIMEYLLKVGRADSSAQNPKMTKNSFKLLDAMEEMLIKYCKQQLENE